MKNNDLSFYSKVIEATIFSSQDPVKEELLISKIPDNIKFEKIINIICKKYSDNGVECMRIGDAWTFRTRLEVSEYLNMPKKELKPLSRAALETLTIIAYHQPITRSEIEKIRGVSISKGSMDILLELNWIKPKGRKQSPGRPITWGTTDNFLDKFCLEGLSSLPGISELKAIGLIGSSNIITDDIKDFETIKQKDEDSLINDLIGKKT